jgi:hypothetical protein
MPNRRAGKRQRTCGRPECQRERHRRNCEGWHRRNPEYDRECRLRGRLFREEAAEESGELRGPMSGLDESMARDTVGMEVYVFVDEVAKHLESWARDSVGLQPIVINGGIVRHAVDGARDEIVKRGPSP